MSAIEVLQEKLLGNFYSIFRVGDAFDLYFDGLWLIAHGVFSTDEGEINTQLPTLYPRASDAVDKEDVA